LNLSEIAKYHLQEMEELAKNLGDVFYIATPKILFGASVGKHYRHIIEFYQSLINGLPNGTINYDKRNRDIRIENDINYAMQMIVELKNQLSLMSNADSKPVVVEYEYDNHTISSVSSSARELIFCIEHCVHHLAILKLAIHAAFEGVNVSATLGVAHSTLSYQQSIQQS